MSETKLGGGSHECSKCGKTVFGSVLHTCDEDKLNDMEIKPCLNKISDHFPTNTKILDKLLPCPFCGSKPKYYVDDEVNNEGHNLHCCYIDMCSIELADVIENWNNRYIPLTNLAKDQQDIPPEFAKVINDNFDELVESSDKPVRKQPLEAMYNYREVIDYIEKKYNIKTRDYANRHSYCYNANVPYQDFWHWVLESNDNLSNGSKMGFYVSADEVAEEPEFVQEIIKIFRDEGFYDENEYFEAWVSW